MSSQQLPVQQQQQPLAPTHPVAVFFHSAFKVAAVVFYILCETVNKNQFVTNFVVCIVLLAMDFWTVKNVTGRLLVGLRWWNDANDGGSAWRFESLAEGQRAINPHESRWFWTVLVANQAVWGLMCLMALLRLNFGKYLCMHCSVCIEQTCTTELPYVAPCHPCLHVLPVRC
eukprot:jgi/Chrzof1/6674/Cz19g05090.t1